MKRCDWPDLPNDPLYQEYHDQEWGKLNLAEQYLYEMVVLESFQSGLSWRTILHKRKNFRKAFAGFDYQVVANYDQAKIASLMADPGIVRNRRKIEAAVADAQAMCKLHQNGQKLGTILQEATKGIIVNYPKTFKELPNKTQISIDLSKKLKQLGFKFVGPVTVYSYLEAIGLINDHIVGCEVK